MMCKQQVKGSELDFILILVPWLNISVAPVKCPIKNVHSNQIKTMLINIRGIYYLVGWMDTLNLYTYIKCYFIKLQGQFREAFLI